VTTFDVEDPEYTRPIQALAPEPSTPVQSELTPAEARVTDEGEQYETVTPTTAAGGEILYVPLAVSVGDGFKFGCGFFMAFVVAMLLGFVLLSALFALSSVLGVGPLVSP
jgi:hypothetical protein